MSYDLCPYICVEDLSSMYNNTALICSFPESHVGLLAVRVISIRGWIFQPGCSLMAFFIREAAKNESAQLQ